MPELVDDVLELLAPYPSANALAKQIGFDSALSAATAAQLAVPLIVAGMVHRLNDPDGSDGLIEIVAAVDTTDLRDFGATLTGRRYEPVGSAAVKQIFGSKHHEIAAKLAPEAECVERSAAEVFSPMAWAVTGLIAKRNGTEHNRHSLQQIIRNEHDGLLRTGWGQWMASVSPEEPMSTSPGESRPVPSAHSTVAEIPLATEMKSDDAASRYPQPVRRARTDQDPKAEAIEQPGLEQADLQQADNPDTPQAPGDSDDSEPPSARVHQKDPVPRVPGVPRTTPGGLAPARPPEVPPTPGPVGPIARPGADRERELQPRGGLWVVAAVGAMLLGGAILWFLTKDSSDSAIATSQSTTESTAPAAVGSTGEPVTEETPTETTDSTGSNSTGSNNTGSNNTGSNNTGSNSGESDGAGSDGAVLPTEIVPFDVTVADGSGPDKVSATASLQFDLKGKELCYDVTSRGIDAPLRAELGRGIDPAASAIVDLGLLAESDIGCVAMDTLLIEAILGDPATYYVVLSEAEGSRSIRAQLTE